MNMKTGIVILAVLALCFFTGVGNGLLRTNDTSTPTPGTPTPTPTNPPWADRINNLFPHGKLTFEDISGNANCFDPDIPQLRLTQGQTCSYTLSTAFLPRNGSLTLVKGFQADVTIRQPVKENGETGITTNEPVWAGTPLQFRLSSRQSKTDTIDLTIVCRIGGPEAGTSDLICRLVVTEPQEN